jgi:multiple sugar transport system substrate-binding protein
MKFWSKAAAVSLLALATAVPGVVAAAELTFWNGFTGPDRPSVEAITAEFSAANPGSPVTMDIMPWDSLMQKLLTSLASGSGPDVVAINFANLPRFAKSGYIMDLTAQVTAANDLDPANWSDGLKSVLQVDGRYFATPMNYATVMMYYNKDLFAAAGLDPENPPKTWEEWIPAIKATTRIDGEAQYGLTLPDHQTIPNWPILLWGNGADIVADGQPGLADPKAVEALKMWSDLVVNDKISPTGLTGAEADKLFETGKAAMGITGPWMTNGFTAAGLNYDVAPIPAGPAGPVTLGDTVVMLINKNTDDPEAAVKFLAHWNSKASQLKFANDTGFPPSRTDLAGSAELTNPWAAKFSAVVPISRFNLAGQTNFSQINDDVFTPLIQTITLGRDSVENATTMYNEQLGALVE